MVQLSPDTSGAPEAKWNGQWDLTGWDHCSGYHYGDNFCLGFSHTHLQGTGAADLADVLLMPLVEGRNWSWNTGAPGQQAELQIEALGGIGLSDPLDKRTLLDTVTAPDAAKDQDLHLVLKAGNELSLRSVEVRDIVHLRPPALLFFDAGRKIAVIGKRGRKLLKQVGKNMAIITSRER